MSRGYILTKTVGGTMSSTTSGNLSELRRDFSEVKRGKEGCAALWQFTMRDLNKADILALIESDLPGSQEVRLAPGDLVQDKTLIEEWSA